MPIAMEMKVNDSYEVMSYFLILKKNILIYIRMFSLLL